MNKRLSLLKKYIGENNLSCVLITNEKNMRYLSSYTGEGYLVITEDKDFLVTDFRYTEQAGVQAPDFEICDIASLNASEKFGHLKKAGFENTNISYDRYSRFSEVFGEMIPLGTFLTEMRSVKDPAEIDAISRAQDIADRAFSHILGYLKPDVSEKDIALELEYTMRRLGADAIAFDSVVATGAHGAMPHAEPDSRKIKYGDMVVLDFGCVCDGYCSDMTRTVCVGKASNEAKAVYNTVLEAQLTSLDMLCEGVTGAELHKKALDIIDKKYPDTFGHALGHGVGLDIHEAPTLSIRNTNSLVKGNVVTVEPGIYIPGFFGVRIEDLVVIDGDKYTNLTKSDKKLIEL